jgi:hypothetical protein
MDYYYAIATLDRTNPGRSEFSIPVFIREMVDIPDMFRVVAKSFAELVGGSYLSYKFGFSSFVNDVKELAKICVIIEKRIRELESLQRHGGLRRKIELDKFTTRNERYDYIHSTWGLTLQGTITHSSVIYVHGTVRWLPKTDLYALLQRIGAINLAVRNVFDLELLDAKTLWELFPWTWLSDFFVDTGAWLGAFEDSDYYQYADLSVIWSGTATERVEPDPPPGISASRGVYTGHVYSRTSMEGFSFYTPPGRVELLGKNQLKILLALFLRFGGKIG